ncbi:MAG: transporter substrate-binding protein [Paenibacillaceae bacterium]|nr:transporter substrate-binding protein [Paenibacillaceae bacterium]
MWQKKGLALVMGTALLAGGLAGCGGKEEGAAAVESKEPTTISIMTTFYSKEAPTEENLAIKELEKQTNTKLKFTWVTSNNYNDKSNVTLASGDLPDLMLVNDLFTPQIRQMAVQGAFWDVTELVKDYKNLVAYGEEAWTNTKMQDGRNYGIPRPRPVEGAGSAFPVVRKDWLDKLGMSIPETVEDIYQVMKAFKEKDPDGDGKHETVPFAANIEATWMGKLMWMEDLLNGSPGRWKVKDGQLVYSALEPGTREALVWANKFYKEGLLPEDAIIMKASQAEELLGAGKAGFSTLGTIESTYTHELNAKKVDPNAQIVALPYLTGPFGKMAYKGTGYFGAYLIPKTVPEAKVKKILEFLDWTSTQEADDLMRYGVKDVHYTVQNGVKTPNPDQAYTNSADLNQFMGGIVDYYNRAVNVKMDAEMTKRNKAILDERAKVSMSDPSTGLYSETGLLVQKELEQKIQDLKSKIILGKEPITAWDDYANMLKANGDFQKFAKEMNEAYQKRVGTK